MADYNPKNDEKIILLLKQMDADFEYDKQGIKNRLMNSIQTSHLGQNLIPDQTKFHRRWNFALGTGLAVVVVFVSTLNYADAAKPGDKLYFMDQWSEQVGLNIPRTAASRAKYKSKIIDERIQELMRLEAITPNPTIDTVKLRALQKTQQNIVQTVEETAEAKKKLQEKHRDKSLRQLETVFTKLEMQAQDQEMRMQRHREQFITDENRADYDERLELIKQARLKARLELQNFNPTNSLPIGN